ncbi:MAG TPA: flagellar protein FlbD [Ruminiclostridium sp.]|jgi:flagellar protein FlbD|nr:flagellar protein FlbD [Ruminiclostridium sp.]
MITVTRFNKTRFVINADWIETVESTPDTVITLTNGKKFIVSEPVEDIVRQVIEYKQKTFILNRTINSSSENDDK